MSRVPLHPRVIAALVLAVAVALSAAARAAEPPRASEAELRDRAARLFELRLQAARTGGVPMEQLRADLVDLAAQLEAARLDSLAADARHAAAGVLSRLGRTAEAEQQLNLAVADALRAHDPRRQLRSRLFLAEMRVSADPALAQRTVEEALPAARALGDDDLLGDAYSTLTHAQLDLGRFEDGLLSARRAAAHYSASGNLHQQNLVLCQCSQALRFLGRHPEARAITDSVLASAREHDDGMALSRALAESASLYRTKHQYPEALAALDEAVALDRRRGDRVRERNGRINRARLYQSMGRPNECAADLDTLFASPDVQGSLPLLVRVGGLKARALVNLGRAAEADTMLAGVATRYERFRAALASEEDRAGVGEHAAEMYLAWTRVKLALGREDEAWRACERGRGVSIEARLATGDPTLAEVQRVLARSNAALIEYDSVDPEVGSVFVVWGGGVRGFPMKKPMTLGDLNAVLDAAGAPAAGQGADSAAARLAQSLLAPMRRAIPAEIERLCIVPPSRLESLPFEYLPLVGDSSAATLGERYAVSYSASAGTRLALDRRAAAPKGVTVIADPAVDASRDVFASLEPNLRGEVLKPLPGARAEAKLLAEPGAKLLLGKDATLDRLLKSLPAAVLHIATHALDDPKSAERGGLVLAGRDPLLTPARLESLTVAADLVTLSACGTLGSTSYSGEGRFGLTRAFLASGSRSVLSTRWAVSDRAAARFMEEFYAQLRAGAPRDRSLVRARERLRTEGFPPRDCWAFMLSGVGDQPVSLWAGKSAALPK